MCPSYSWKCQECLDKVSVYRSISNFETAPSRQCPECGSLGVECITRCSDDCRFFYCNDCSGATWTEQCGCGTGDWRRLMCAPIARWRFCD